MEAFQQDHGRLSCDGPDMMVFENIKSTLYTERKLHLISPFAPPPLGH